MRPNLLRLASLTLIALVAGAVPAVPLAAAEEGPRTSVFINHRVVPAARRIALNQPIRLEFVSQGRQVAGIDITAAVTNGIDLVARDSWRLVGPPTVVESEKTKTITVTLVLMPRATGDLPLPRFPMTWLSGDPQADFGVVTVGVNLQVAGEARPLPPECDGVGGLLWGAQLADVKDRLPGATPKIDGDRTVVRANPGLDLVFRNGELTEALVQAPGLTLEQARASFLERWGVPVQEDSAGLVWSFGWTKIVATPGKEGVTVNVLREDLQARQTASKVKARVFSAFEQPVGPAGKP